MKVVKKRLATIDELRPSEDNPRTISRERMDSLRKSLRENPEHLEARPIVARADGTIIAGEMRWRAAGLEEIAKLPTVFVELTDDEAREWLLRDNMEYGEWHEQQLAEMLYKLEQAGRDLDMTGFSREETTRLIDLVAGPQRPHNWPDEPAPPRPDKPKSRVGQVYKLGPHRLMCGDATNPKHVQRLLEEAKPRLLATDPPYGVELQRDGEDAMQGDTRVDWSEAFELVPSLTVAYVWHASSYGADVALGLRRVGYEIAQQIIWDKIVFALGRSDYQWRHETALYAARTGEDVPWYGPANGTAWYARKKGAKRPWLGDRTQTTMWSAPSPKRNLEGSEEAEDHPTQKPTLLWTTPIKNHLNRGEELYDPFAGSGTAIIAAEMTNRVCYAMELDPGFADVIRERYATYTGGEK